MITSFITFSVCTYVTCFLVADAKIFGCSTASFLEDPTDTEFLQAEGVLKLRNWLLRKSIFLRKLFSCYLCLGLWCGPVVHLLFTAYAHFNPIWRNSYFLWGQPTLPNLAVGSVIAGLLGAGCSFLVNLLVSNLESHN